MRQLLTVVVLTVFAFIGCDLPLPDSTPQSASGVRKANVQVQTNADGHTTEQDNVMRRYKVDNTPGAIKHLYVISAMTGDVLIYSTVKGKVTSSGKRLTPTSVNYVWNRENVANSGFPVEIGGRSAVTSEVLQDDGTYGNSLEYVFWFDVRGTYHQHYVQGGQILHVADQPIVVKTPIINMEVTQLTTAKGE